jgi:dipeptidyl aminopeptidase/acylaminoacyl peptidase
MNRFGRLLFPTWLAVAACIAAGAGAPVRAQDPAFGKNKVIWKDFDWSYVSTKHYDIYFYNDNYALASFAANVLEEATPQVENELNYRLREKVPVLVYDSHNDFQQTNVGGGLIPEGVGGFTESFKNRVVLPFSGSYEDFRHVLHHELTHAFTFDMLYGGGIGSFIAAGTLFQLPLWFAEGYAEYSSQHGMDYFGDMVLRDAVINDYIIPLQYAGGFIVYKEGQSAIQFIADHFGQEKIHELLSRSRTMLSMEKGMKAALGLSMKDFDKEWMKALQREYWPEIARRQEPKELGKVLTRHDEQGSNYNEKPAFSPQGDRIAIFSDRSDYTEVYIISAVDGKFLKRLVKGERSADFESLHSYVSGLSWSPDASRIALVGKSEGKDALVVVDSKGGKVRLKTHLGVTSLLNPAWGPTGRIAYMGMVDGQADLYTYDLESKNVDRYTHDRYDDNEPTWSPDGRYIVFASDRPTGAAPRVQDSAFNYGHYHLFQLEVATGKITALTSGEGNDREPTYSPDGERIAFVSDRNGIANLYVYDVKNGSSVPVTDILTGASSPSWSPKGDKLAFSSFNNGGFDIFLMEEIKPRGKDGVLEPTPLALRKRGIKAPPQPADTTVAHPTAQADTTALPQPVDSAGSLVALAPADSNVAPADTQRAADTTQADSALSTITPMRRGGHLGSLRFRADEPAADSTGRPLRKADLTADSVVILDPQADSQLVAQRVEAAKKEGQNEEGEYEVRKYKAKFSPDLVTGAVGYDSFLGLQGQSYLLVSDYMANHQFFLATDVINTFDDANVLFYYENSAKRNNFGIGLFHTRVYYVDNDQRLVGRSGGVPIYDTGRLFSDRYYGAVGQLRHPLSLFRRLELNASHVYIDREYYDPDTSGVYDDSKNQATVLGLSYVSDNTLWGITGPVNGGRSNFTIEHAFDLSDRSVSYTAFNADWRKYFKLGNGFSFAARLAGGVSGGRTPKRYYLGGVPNWIGSDLARENEIYTVQNLYFSQLSYPLRGYDYFELAGSRYGLVNLELRNPLIEYFALRFPLGLVLSHVQGALFVDAGAAWDKGQKLVLTESAPGSRLKDLKVGYGFGMRANLGFLVFRYDVAWPTDFRIFARRASQYVSLGADF